MQQLTGWESVHIILGILTGAALVTIPALGISSHNPWYT